MTKTILYTLLLLCFSVNLKAQNLDSLYKDDVSSIEKIVEAMLGSISGSKGAKRDWSRFRNLFMPSAQLNAVFHKNDSSWIKINTIDEFVDKAGNWYIDNGFYEYSLKNTIDKFGNIAHVFQSYGTKLEDGKKFERGINSYQLVFGKNRWWIVNLIWDSETTANRIDLKYIK